MDMEKRPWRDLAAVFALNGAIILLFELLG